MSRITRLLDLENTTRSRIAWRTPLAIALSSMVAAGCLVNLDASAGAAAPMVQQEQSAEGSFPTTESMRNELQAEIDRGHLSEEQAIQIERIHERLLMALETGRVNTEQALKILEERAGAVYENAAEEVRGQVRASMATADYDEAVSKMLRMVKSGEITREQMEQRLERMKQMMVAEKAVGFSKADYDAAVKKMTEMVKSGQITREQMAQRLEEMKRRMAAAKPSFSMAEYAEAQAKMTKMVEAGEITREEMNQRLARMRSMMAGDAGAPKRAIPAPPEGASPREVREWYLRVEDRLNMAVETGRMSGAEKDAMLQKIKAQLRSRSSK